MSGVSSRRIIESWVGMYECVAEKRFSALNGMVSSHFRIIDASQSDKDRIEGRIIAAKSMEPKQLRSLIRRLKNILSGNMVISA